MPTRRKLLRLALAPLTAAALLLGACDQPDAQRTGEDPNRREGVPAGSESSGESRPGTNPGANTGAGGDAGGGGATGTPGVTGKP